MSDDGEGALAAFALPQEPTQLLKIVPKMHQNRSFSLEKSGKYLGKSTALFPPLPTLQPSSAPSQILAKPLWTKVRHTWLGNFKL